MSISTIHARAGSAPVPRQFSPRTDAYQYALHYLSWGWSVFPVFQKRPAVEYWAGRRKKRSWKAFQHGPPDEDFLRRIFDVNEGAAERIDGLAVVTGPVSGGLAVRDFDTIDGYRLWARSRPELARRLPTARTSRGAHVFFRLPAGGRVYRKFSGREKGELLGDGKHYVVLPPSRHPSGTNYSWWSEPVSIDEFPVLTPEQAGFLPDTGPEPARKPLPSTHTLCVPRETGGCSDLGEAVMRCLPAGPGERNECLWKLARTVKGICPDATDEELLGVVGGWYRSAEGVIGTKSVKVCWRDFQRQWESALPLGAAFDEAMAAALERPTPPEAERYREPSVAGPVLASVHKLAKVCVALQVYHGAGPFYLSCRTAQRLCGFRDHKVANAWLSQFVEDGLLELVERGSAGSETARRASEYRWRALPASPRHAEPQGETGSHLAA